MTLVRVAVRGPNKASAGILSRPWAVRSLSAAAAVVAVAALSGASPTGAPNTVYYVSLGDSLASGYQPDVHQDTKIAYTDKLFDQLKRKDPGLQHIRLGCIGETSASMISGGKCTYPGAKSQLDAAVKFLSQHRGQVKYLTADIGANDIDTCFSASGVIDSACIQKNTATLAQNLPQITGALQQAKGPKTVLAGMTYYNPFLALWLKGDAGQQAAKASAQLQAQTNTLLANGYAASGFRVADVAKAFSSSDFSTQAQLPQIGAVPVNVARVCQLTWACTPYQDVHANPTGHDAIAGAFAAVLTHDSSQPAPSASATAGRTTPTGTTQSATPQAGLASTGPSRNTPIIAGIGCAVAAAGAGLLVVTRRRRARRH
ncbi:GDSL-like lipase/acylhydrolase family protein [Streptomyces sp. TLI_235]|nr:SGNH/GDSL hydrolase family protein [Streptomyces sp. TLI_235]PBC69656.1 GDSL-like lipase/acylhydrolase family protein [Streptomyces sp. TLI_235]